MSCLRQRILNRQLFEQYKYIAPLDLIYYTNHDNEINIWRKCRKVAKEYEAQLNEKGFTVDWVGRMYTVINLPQEVIDQPVSEEGYVLMKLREYDKFFMKQTN